MDGIASTINPDRHRRQKEKVTEYVKTGREKKAAEIKKQQQHEDFWRHNFSDRVRVIRQMKAVLGFPLLQYEDYEYVSDKHFSKRYDEAKLKEALGYFDKSIPAEDFDRLMIRFDQFFLLESWLNQRYTMIKCFEFKGEFWKREVTLTDVFPNFNDPYWFDPNKVNMESDNWREWKVRSLQELLEKALKAAEGANTVEKVLEAGEAFRTANEVLQKTPSAKNTSPGDVLNGPDVVWNGSSSEHFTPRKRLWRRIIAVITNQKP